MATDRAPLQRDAIIDEARELFVLSCQFGRRAITPSEYASLATDPDWQLKHLLDR